MPMAVGTKRGSLHNPQRTMMHGAPCGFFDPLGAAPPYPIAQCQGSCVMVAMPHGWQREIRIPRFGLFLSERIFPQMGQRTSHTRPHDAMDFLRMLLAMCERSFAAKRTLC